MPNEPAPSPPTGAQPSQPLPQSVQRVVMVLMLAGCVGLFFLLRETADVHDVHDASIYQGTATFEVSGEVLHTSEENLALRAMVEYESFTLGDSTGQFPVYYRADDLPRPADGSHVTVEGANLRVAGEGGPVAFIAHRITAD